MMQNRVFLDTSFSIAIAIEKDDFHKRALDLADKIEAKNTHIFTTQAIILEIGNALSKLKYRQSAVGIILHLESDLNTSIISLTNKLYRNAFELFRNRPDKEWGLIDCISFIVMKARKITDALWRSLWLKRALRLLSANPFASRTVGTPTTSTGKLRSSTKAWMTRNCWKSFSPK